MKLSKIFLLILNQRCGNSLQLFHKIQENKNILLVYKSMRNNILKNSVKFEMRQSFPYLLLSNSIQKVKQKQYVQKKLNKKSIQSKQESFHQKPNKIQQIQKRHQILQISFNTLILYFNSSLNQVQYLSLKIQKQSIKQFQCLAQYCELKMHEYIYTLIVKPL
ncbi:unnamed protein product [Paramecium sonneborni]|uniref:Uncharacterized protein n=1 Tax=Paramecium sonneborni TaxID=65129 RepID=A0A8S1QWU7_9CILI|nr:unnamed protein product [Paramecium sonneborni]